MMYLPRHENGLNELHASSDPWEGTVLLSVDKDGEAGAKDDNGVKKGAAKDDGGTPPSSPVRGHDKHRRLLSGALPPLHLQHKVAVFKQVTWTQWKPQKSMENLPRPATSLRATALHPTSGRLRSAPINPMLATAQAAMKQERRPQRRKGRIVKPRTIVRR